MEVDDYLIFGSVIIFVISVVALFGIFGSINDYRDLVTGFATEGALVNVTVSSVASLNFTNDSISFGSGAVDAGQASATVDTLGIVTNGNWSATTTRFLITNLGNANLTLNISSGKTASSFIGGSSPEYKYNVSDSGLDVCSPPVGFSLDVFYEVNASPDSRTVCDNFESGQNITVDLKFVIPNNSVSGLLSDTLSVTYSAV